MDFKDYLNDFFKLLDEQIDKAERDTLTQKDKEGTEQYLKLLNTIKGGVVEKTKEGKFEPLNGKTINKMEKDVSEYATKRLGTDDGQKYIRIYFNGKENKIKTMTTKFGTKIWRTGTDEGEKASAYGHKLQGIIYDFFNPKKQEEFENLLPEQ